MQIRLRFTKLMKSEPSTNTKKRSPWIVDQSKCFTENENATLQQVGRDSKFLGIDEGRFRLIRMWFMVELGLNAGLRVSEMTSLNHGNLLLSNGKSSISVIGKGNKKRSIWISASFKKTIETYSSLKNQFGFSTSTTAPLLVNLEGKWISKRALQKDFKDLLEQAILPNSYSIHCMRHTYATFLLIASGYNYRFVQQQLGHSSIRTTQIYASVLETEGRRAVELLYSNQTNLSQ